MLEHGYEGVRQIEVHVTNTMGWSATTGEVQPWVYQQITQTFILDPRDARPAGQAESDRLGQSGQSAARSFRTQATGSPTSRCSRRCAPRAKNWKIDSKASIEGVAA